MIHQARLGNSQYSLERVVSGNVRITRSNADGTEHFFVPESLLRDFAKQLLIEKLFGESA